MEGGAGLVPDHGQGQDQPQELVALLGIVVVELGDDRHHASPVVVARHGVQEQLVAGLVLGQPVEHVPAEGDIFGIAVHQGEEHRGIGGVGEHLQLLAVQLSIGILAEAHADELGQELERRGALAADDALDRKLAEQTVLGAGQRALADTFPERCHVLGSNDSQADGQSQQRIAKQANHGRLLADLGNYTPRESACLPGKPIASIVSH